MVDELDEFVPLPIQRWPKQLKTKLLSRIGEEMQTLGQQRGDTMHKRDVRIRTPNIILHALGIPIQDLY